MPIPTLPKASGNIFSFKNKDQRYFLLCRNIHFIDSEALLCLKSWLQLIDNTDSFCSPKSQLHAVMKEKLCLWCWDTTQQRPVMDPQPTCIVVADWSAPWACCLSLIMLSSVDQGPESHGSRPSQKFLALAGRSCGLFLSGRGNHCEFPTTLPITSKQMDGGHRWVLHAGSVLQVLW